MIKAYPCEDGSTIVTDINRLPVCKLKKMQTDNGFFRFVKGKAYIGKPYKYSAKTRRVHTILNKPTGQEFECEIVMVYDERGHFAMMPTECLDFS